MHPDITNEQVFKPLEALIRQDEYGDGDIHEMIASMIDQSPLHASAMSLHARDILVEFGEGDLDYTDILVMIYWRTYFSPAHAPLYGTDQMVHNPEALENFVQFMLNPEHVEVKNANVAPRPSLKH